ncbi:MAG TPA: MFS transporter [Candidatus Binatia bacterium]|nr:MFS transporter [Candidatus Binatia bacterium]
MNTSIRTRLFIMMVLEFFIWGAWLPPIFGYLPSLGFSASDAPLALQPIVHAVLPKALWFIFSEQSLILNAFPIAAIVGMFFSNQYADRHFSAERFMAFSHFVGGIAILMLAWTTSFWWFFTLMLVHCLLYVPTNSIANSIAFATMKDPQKEFGLVRMGGTLGWILAAWPFTFILVDWAKVREANPHGLVDWIGTALKNGLSGDALKHGIAWTYIVAGIASLVLAAYSLTLPHTPPKKVERGADRFAWLEAFKLLKHPFMLVLWLVTFVDAFVLYSYFNWTWGFLGADRESGGVGIPGNWIMPVMSLGQIAELLTMFILGATLKRLGWRWTMVIGILGHAARFSVYAFWPEPAPIIVVQLLHGICYAFFFATVYIFADEYFPKDVRASAQGLFNVMVLGVGNLAANCICPYLMQFVFTHNGVINFKSMFLIPLAAAGLAALTLALLFRPPPKPQESAPAGAAAVAA